MSSLLAWSMSTNPCDTHHGLSNGAVHCPPAAELVICVERETSSSGEILQPPLCRFHGYSSTRGGGLAHTASQLMSRARQNSFMSSEKNTKIPGSSDRTYSYRGSNFEGTRQAILRDQQHEKKRSNKTTGKNGETNSG